MAEENWSNQEALNRALNIYRSAMRKFIVRHLDDAFPDPKKAIKEALPKKTSDIEKIWLKTNGNIAECIDINDFPNLVDTHWNKVFLSPFRGSLRKKVTDTLRQITDGRNLAYHPPTSDLKLKLVRTQLEYILEVLKLIREPDEVRKEVSEIKHNLTTLGGPPPELKPALQRSKGPNEAKLHKALRIFRDAMSKFIVHHLGYVFVGNQVDAVKRELPTKKISEFEKRLKETGSIEASIDIDDCRSLVQDCWDNPFSTLFQNDSLILDTLSLIINGRNQIAQYGTTDLEPEYVRTLLFHIFHLLKCIDALVQANRISEIRDDLVVSTGAPIKPETDGLSKPNPRLKLGGEAFNKIALHKALNIFRDTMSPFIVHYLYDEFVGNAEEAVKRALPKGRDTHFEQRLRETERTIIASIDIDDFPYLVDHYWRDTFSKSFKNNPKILPILPTLRLITDGCNQVRHIGTSGLEPEYVRTQLFHIFHLLQCINKPGQAGKADSVGNNREWLRWTQPLLQCINKPDQADKVSEFRNNPVSPSASPNNKGPDILPTQEVTATLHTTSHQIPREHLEELSEPFPESKPSLKNQEHLNVAALHEALNIFRNAMSPFIVHHLGHVLDGNVENLIQRALSKERGVRFEQRLRKTGNIEASIDIDDCCSLVQCYWNDIFSQFFKNNSEIVKNRFAIYKESNQEVYLGTSDLEQEFVRDQLFRIIDLLKHINKTDEAKAVAEIRDNLVTLKVPPNKTGPDPSPTQEVTATFDTASRQMPREHPDGLFEPHPELKSALKNQEHLNAAALHEALGIFRDTMSPFIVHHLGHVLNGNVENLIQRTLSKERGARFEQRLRKTGNIEACIDIDDCCSLVQCYWNDIFSALFQDDSGILSTLSLIEDESNQIVHPETPVLNPEYVRIRLSHIADLLQRIEKPGPADAVLRLMWN